MKRVARGILTAFVVAAALVAGGATPAHAATAHATLIAPCEDSFGNVFDLGIIVDARTQRTYQDGFRVVWRVWGDDPSSDDLLAGPFTDDYPGFRPPSLFPVGLCSNGNSTFDEDIGQDEIYFGIRVFDRITGGQLEIVESNRIVGNF